MKGKKHEKRVPRLVAALYAPVAASLVTVLALGVTVAKGPQAAGD